MTDNQPYVNRAECPYCHATVALVRWFDPAGLRYELHDAHEIDGPPPWACKGSLRLIAESRP